MRGPEQSKVRVERPLRRQSTDVEVKLWFTLRDRRLGGCKFVRQEATGSYVVDFVCREKKLIVEVDGGHAPLSPPYAFRHSPVSARIFAATSSNGMKVTGIRCTSLPLGAIASAVSGTPHQ
jgi:hypothetical protein